MDTEAESNYLNKCKSKPFWIKDRDGAMRYASHIAHRLYQEKEKLKVYENFLDGLDLNLSLKIHDEACEKASVLDEIWLKDPNPTKFTNWDE